MVAHMANRALCQALGDRSQPTWSKLPDIRKQGIIRDVDLFLNHNFIPPVPTEDANREAELKLFSGVVNALRFLVQEDGAVIDAEVNPDHEKALMGIEFGDPSATVEVGDAPKPKRRPRKPKQ